MKIGRIKRGAFMLPTLMTTGNLAMGCLGVALLLNRGQDAALTCAVLIIIAGLLDGFDGVVARLTRSSSRFGMEFDSLADMVSFGMAPAMLAYAYSLKAMGTIGLVACVWYVTCAAWRLARFNATEEEDTVPGFRGLPSPAAAGTVASFVILVETTARLKFQLVAGLSPEWAHASAAPWVSGGVAVLGWLMISNTPYLSMKGINFARPRLGLAFAVIVFAYVLISLPQLLFPLSLAYIFLGLATRFLTRVRWAELLAPTLVEWAGKLVAPKSGQSANSREHK